MAFEVHMAAWIAKNFVHSFIHQANIYLVINVY